MWKEQGCCCVERGGRGELGELRKGEDGNWVEVVIYKERHMHRKHNYEPSCFADM